MNAEYVVITMRVKWGSVAKYHSVYSLQNKAKAEEYCQKLTEAYPDMAYRTVTLCGCANGKKVRFPDSDEEFVVK